MKLESQADARRFHARMVDACIRAHAQAAPLRPEQLKVAIIGAGATGVELAADLQRTTREVLAYGLDRVDPDRDLQGTLIEASDRVLPALPPRLSRVTQEMLTELGVKLHTSVRVAECFATACGWRMDECCPPSSSSGRPASRRREFLEHLGLETNGVHQLVVRPTLQTTCDDDILALGDCAYARGATARCRLARRQHISRRCTCTGRFAAASPASRCRNTATATSDRWCRWASSARSAT